MFVVMIIGLVKECIIWEREGVIFEKCFNLLGKEVKWNLF